VETPQIALKRGQLELSNEARIEILEEIWLKT
jgi:hypothetical protein